MDPTKFSRNYKFGSSEGNMIFEGTSYLPKEVMLEMTLKAFGYDIDMVEVMILGHLLQIETLFWNVRFNRINLSPLKIGMEGTGFEPTVEALFGENGFFPDTAMQTMYFVSDNMPQRIREVMQNVIPAFKADRINRQVFQLDTFHHNLENPVASLAPAVSAGEGSLATIRPPPADCPEQP